MHTQLHQLYENFDENFVNDGVDTCLIVQENNTLTPHAKSGNITFNFTNTTDDFLQFELFNVEVGGTIFALSNNVITEIPIKPAINQIQDIVVYVPNVEFITIEFEGPGGVCGVKSCLEVVPLPSPVGYGPPTPTPTEETPYPTTSPPSSDNIESFQPTDCYDLLGITEKDIINQVGSDEPIPEDVVKIIHGEYENVTIVSPTPVPSSVPPTVTESIQPTDCYDLYGITEDDIINQVGSEEPIPENAIKIISGENTNITLEISQLWSQNTNLTFFIHYHSHTHESVCEAVPDFSYGDALTKNLECYDGWTDVGIFLYFDSELTLEECEECRPPDSDEEGVIAYYFELPCDPICAPFELFETQPTPSPTMAPTTMAPTTMAPTTEAPTTMAPTTMAPTTEAPTDCYDLYGITEKDIINQIGSEEPIPENAIKIISGENSNITIEISQLWSADLNLTFFIHYHSHTHESVCEAVSDFSYMDTLTKNLECYDGWTDVGIFLYFNNELTLEECEECRPPDNDEEGVIAYYFELPCAPICAPFELIEFELTPSPTRAPITEAPTDCYDLYGITEDNIINQVGSEVPIPENAIKIINGENTNITLENPECYDGVMALERDTGLDTMCEISSQPFTIEELDDSGSNEVRFSFQNIWPATMASIDLYYDRGDGSGGQCQSLNSLSSGELYPSTLAAACDRITHTTEIEVYVGNDDISYSSKNDRCGNSRQGSCSYVFKIPCSAGVMCNNVRRLNDSLFTEL
eukprot:jgi/Psemu1/324194/estExt_fgenesh1_pg.C_1250015